MNIANKLTIARVVMIPFFLLAIYLIPGDAGRWIAAVIFIVASATDFIDGYLARSRNLVTEFGKFMDPLADKLLVAAALIYMVEAGQLAAWMTIVIISREFAVSAFRLVASLNGRVIAAGPWGKVKTFVTMAMIVVVILPLQLPFKLLLDNLLIYASVVLTILSAMDYFIRNKDVLKE